MLDFKNEVLSDTDIIDRVIDGDTRLYEVIVKKYNPFLYRIGRAYGFWEQDVRDIMQETYVNAFRNLSKFKRESTFKTWLTRIMLNNCYHIKQKFSKRNEVSADSLEYSQKVYLTSETMEQRKTVNKELGSILEKAIQNLPEKYKLVFTLRELNACSILETSDALGISSGNVKVRLSRAKALLRGEIEKVYSPEDIFELNLIYCDGIVEKVMKEIYRGKVK
ncbi:MAG: sigma-70 family RNA polymerase sigma factor [Ginsengibacter sp.]